MTAGTELDKELMGLRPGRRPAQPKPIELTQAEELELAKAKAGRVEWVGPGVAAYILGISKEALKKRRLRGEGVVPEHRAAKSNKHGVRYRWSSVVRCGGAERFQSEVLAERLEDVVEVLKKLGLAGLERDLPWAFTGEGRIKGLADFHPYLPAIPLPTSEALRRPWVSLEGRTPFDDMAARSLSAAEAEAMRAAEWQPAIQPPQR
ncbi:hypothetical protein [Stenotrophomonas muris]|uniref:hypothetical protein n=1 Tax=Stenotrophomonas muris TaxID=2963283 RepID=UPI000C158642